MSVDDDVVTVRRPSDTVEADRRLTLMLAEYSAVRAEIIQSLQAQHAIVSYGASALAVLTAVAVGTASSGNEARTGLITFLFLVLNPVLLVVILMIWGSEVQRMQRAGVYLFVLERVLTAGMKPRPLNWEHAVNPPPNGRKGRTLPHVDFLQRIAVPAAFIAMLAGSIAAGVSMGRQDWLVAFSLLAVAAGVAAYAWLETERRALRGLYAKVCSVEASSPGQLSMEAWVEGMEPWPTLSERLAAVRRRTSARTSRA